MRTDEDFDLHTPTSVSLRERGMRGRTEAEREER